MIWWTPARPLNRRTVIQHTPACLLTLEQSRAGEYSTQVKRACFWWHGVRAAPIQPVVMLNPTAQVSRAPWLIDFRLADVESCTEGDTDSSPVFRFSTSRHWSILRQKQLSQRRFTAIHWHEGPVCATCDINRVCRYGGDHAHTENGVQLWGKKEQVCGHQAADDLRRAARPSEWGARDESPTGEDPRRA